MRLTPIVVALMAGTPLVAAQRPISRPPAPAGQEMIAQDGDRVIIEDDARVQIVRRRQAMVRTVYNETDHSLMVLFDYAPRSGDTPDGRVDMATTYSNVSGSWPLGERWEGFVTVDEYYGNTPSPRGIGLRTAQGLVQLVATVGPPDFHPEPDPSAAAVLTFRGFSGGANGGRLSFDQAEQQQQRLAGASVRRDITGSFSTWSSSGGSNDPGSGAIRVGGPVAAPRQISDVAPVYPEQARQANVRGIVILELTVGADGVVGQVRVLRSIPLLDAAAVDAVRQWRYEPTMLNGTTVPVLMTVTVPVAP